MVCISAERGLWTLLDSGGINFSYFSARHGYLVSPWSTTQRLLVSLFTKWVSFPVVCACFACEWCCISNAPGEAGHFGEFIYFFEKWESFHKAIWLQNLKNKNTNEPFLEHKYVLEIVLSALHVLTSLSSLLHTTTQEVGITVSPILQMRTLRHHGRQTQK